MDKYLQEDSAYERLWAEYHKYGSLIVAVDFDDTLFDFHGTGESYELIKQLIRDLHSVGCKIIIWSGNENINFIDKYLKDNCIPWDLINENIVVNGEWVSGKDSRKVYANVYIDDRGGLKQVYNDLTKLLKEIWE
jgi:hydroxymethylpyrimidine pyrophosphatase-like HAD family hydrolase